LFAATRIRVRRHTHPLGQPLIDAAQLLTELGKHLRGGRVSHPPT
jgi:hypothetical protein